MANVPVSIFVCTLDSAKGSMIIKELCEIALKMSDKMSGITLCTLSRLYINFIFLAAKRINRPFQQLFLGLRK